MNIREHRESIESHVELCSLVGMNPFPTINVLDYFEKLSKPILYNYIPLQVIQQLNQVMTDVVLANKADKRFRIQEEILSPYGFKPLSSGTNRRAFYCDYDSSIVLKLASDSIGFTDNQSEFKMQQLLKPFCPKIFELGLNGVVALTERVETINEYEINHIWKNCVYELVYLLFYKRYGYVIEDVGLKFFKNFGYRPGIGLVVLDFPYVYEVDEEKMKCTWEDPRTGEVCGGIIGYDFNMGLSQITCNKCGRRYSAKYLSRDEKPIDITNEIRNKFDVEVPVVIVKEGKIVFDPLRDN